MHLDIASKSALRIGFFAVHDSEYAIQLMDGVLRYQAEIGECVIREFRYDVKAMLNEQQWLQRPRPWNAWRPDGLIVHTHASDNLNNWIADSGLPVVNTTSNHTPFCAVHMAFDGIAALAVEHFVDLGFTNFAYIDAAGWPDRIAALQRRLKDEGLPLKVIDYGNSPSNLDEDVEQILSSDNRLDDLLSTAHKPLAIIAGNDCIGRGICAAVRRLGLSIPRDVGVLGIGNQSTCRTCDPPLSSIESPGVAVGYRAMQMLVDQINGRPVPDRVQIEPRAILSRESTTHLLVKQPHVIHAIRRMSDRAGDNLSIEQMVGELDVSRSTLYRKCVTTLGRSPAEELSRIRLVRAKQMLDNSQTAITEIAKLLGYARLSNFSDFFKTQTGLTPRAYRKHQKAGQP